MGGLAGVWNQLQAAFAQQGPGSSNCWGDAFLGA